MAIKSHQGPSNGPAVMAAALAARMPASPLEYSPLGGAPHVGGPVPFYHLSLDQLPFDNALDNAARTGWRYPVVGSIKAGLVDIRGDEGTNSASFGGLSHGVVAERFLQASGLADGQLGSSVDEYEPRLLDVPALSFLALWLKAAGGDWFIPLLEGKPPGSAPLQMVREILPQLRAQAALRAVGGARPTSSPTN